MSTLTLPLPDDDLQFLRTWAESQGLTPEAFLARQTHLLRQRVEQPLHPDVTAISGIISPQAVEEDHHLHVEHKHS